MFIPFPSGKQLFLECSTQTRLLFSKTNVGVSLLYITTKPFCLKAGTPNEQTSDYFFLQTVLQWAGTFSGHQATGALFAFQVLKISARSQQSSWRLRDLDFSLVK